MMFKIRHILNFLLIAGILSSCGQTGDEPQPAALTVSPKTIVLDPQGGQENVTITSNEDWLMRSGAKWVKVTTSSGKASASAVKASFTYEANQSGADREDVITIKTLKGTSAEVKLTQANFEGELDVRGISSAQDLMDFAQAVNEGTSLTPFMVNGEIALVKDIDASSIKEWIPVGTKESPFTGVFVGNGYSIKNINWEVDLSKSPYVGLFGYAKGASISGLNLGAAGDVITLKGNTTSLNAAAIVGYAEGGSVTGCKVYASQLYTGANSGGNFRIGGICGYSSAEVSRCDNRGNILCPVVARAAGFVAYNEGTVSECKNFGCILAEKSGEIGPAWACSYNKIPANFTKNTGKGHVGSYATYKDKPEDADWDAYLNAVVSPAKEGYDMAEVTIDNTKSSYLNWKEEKVMQLASGVKYTHCNCLNTPLRINILEINLADPNIEVVNSYANDCVPNPNGNKNKNNGFKIRETLSQLCSRKRNEGQKVIAGINAGFFDSNDGISRGFHIEEGEPVYVNNPDVVKGLSNHSWGITVFTDGTASVGKKGFSGKVKAGGKEFSWRSMNDTIMRNVSSAYQINLYDSHYKQYPHPSNTKLTNKLAKNALYVIAEYTDAPMKVNAGYAAAKVVSIADGRSSALSNPPYITSDKQVGISLSGAQAEDFKAQVSVGATIEFRCDMTIEGETTRPIYTQCSSMFELMKNGADNLSSLPSNHDPAARDPRTYPLVSADKKTLWLVQVDGRQDWFSCGMSHQEMIVLAKKLGAANVTNLDGGGSSTMWVYDAAAGKGSVVNSVSDSKGERSCLNYMLIRLK